MPAIRELGLNVRENGIAVSLGAKVQILTDEEVTLVIKTLRELQPQVNVAKKERLRAQLATLKQQVEDVQNQLEALRNV